jgi:hypothetical protein
LLKASNPVSLIYGALSSTFAIIPSECKALAAAATTACFAFCMSRESWQSDQEQNWRYYEGEAHYDSDTNFTNVTNVTESLKT